MRNTSSAYWRSWLKPRFRCLVPATSYCEYQDGSKLPMWFALALELQATRGPDALAIVARGQREDGLGG